MVVKALPALLAQRAVRKARNVDGGEAVEKKTGAVGSGCALVLSGQSTGGLGEGNWPDISFNARRRTRFHCSRPARSTVRPMPRKCGSYNPHMVLTFKVKGSISNSDSRLRPNRLSHFSWAA
jgi:hypothetical protein